VLTGFKPDLDDQLVSFSALRLGLVIWRFCPVKIVPEMTYNVLSGTLSLYSTTTMYLYMFVCKFLPPQRSGPDASCSIDSRTVGVHNIFPSALCGHH